MVENTNQGKIAVTKSLDRVIMKLLMGDQKITWKSIAFDVVLMILASDFRLSPVATSFYRNVESSMRLF